MNHIGATIIEIIGTPYRAFGRWWIDVMVESYGRKSKSTIMGKARDDVEQKAKIGNEIII